MRLIVPARIRRQNDPTMNKRQRQMFDSIVERVVARLPAGARRWLDEVPLVIEDYPSRKVMAQLEVDHRDELCGLHDGIPLTERSLEGPDGPNLILIYREGIWRLAAEEGGRDFEGALSEQIRITILHEIGHHVGLGEGELEELGYG